MNENFDETVKYITKRYLDNIFEGTTIGSHDLVTEVELVTSEPNVGDHLVTPRPGYTHHGLYIGNGKVIHYEGLYKGFDSGPIKVISLSKFDKVNDKPVGFYIQTHEHRTRTVEEIVAAAKHRKGEQRYHLIWNNCEHFVHDCIYGDSKSYQVNNVFKLASKNVAKAMGKLNPAAQAALALSELKNSISGFIKGDISGKRLMEDVSHTAISSASMSYYGVLGQAAIPIPIAGFLIGSSIGFVIGNSLLSSGHLSLGETPAVKASRERYEQVKEFCDNLTPKVQKSREELKQFLEQHFSERRAVVGNALLQMENSAVDGDIDNFTQSLTTINTLFGNALKIKSFGEFDELMLNDDILKF